MNIILETGAVIVGLFNAVVAIVGMCFVFIVMAVFWIAFAWISGTVLFALWNWASFWAGGGLA